MTELQFSEPWDLWFRPHISMENAYVLEGQGFSEGFLFLVATTSCYLPHMLSNMPSMSCFLRDLVLQVEDKRYFNNGLEVLSVGRDDTSA